jgi:regulator of protease activity HflC (stomatin/prohibitin superfamily)
MVGLFFLLVASVALAVILKKTFVIVGEDERLVVLRLGKVLDVRGSGMNVILPFLDRAIKIDIDEIAGWRRLSESELNRKIVDLALSKPAEGDRQ